MEKLCLIVNDGRKLRICNSLKEIGINVFPVRLEGIPTAWGDIHTVVAKRLKLGFNRFQLPIIDYSYSFQVPALEKDEPFWDFVIHAGGAEGVLEETKKLLGIHRKCERHWCLGFLTGKSQPVEFFDYCLPGFLATSLRGRIVDCITDRIFMPMGGNRTIGEFSDKEYNSWVLAASRQSPVEMFLNWYHRLRG